MIEVIKKPLRPLVRKVRIGMDLFRVIFYDALRFVRYSGVFRSRSHVPSLGALITKQYHRIEKGLALPQPRPGFGEAGIKELCSLIELAVIAGTCRNEVILAVDAIEGYRAFNDSHGIAPKPWLAAVLELAKHQGLPSTGEPIKKGPVPAHGGHADITPDVLHMLVSRASVRDFADAPVPDEVLQNAVVAAQHAPCVCNRQAGRIYLLRDPKLKAAALSYQNGNRGFGDIAPVVAIIAVDQAEMLEPTERYQHWIDGGMFAQNFLLGLHAQGYGACPLNWSASVAKDRGIRRALGFIPPSNAIIMLVVIGTLKDTYNVARSHRRNLSEVAVNR